MREIVRGCPTPREAAQFGRTLQMRDDWEEIKYEVMKNVVAAKVQQHPFIKELLLSTGDEDLVENSPKDYIWGCGRDGSGTNWLGKVYMEVRAQLRKDGEEDPPKADSDLDDWPHSSK